MLKLALTGGMGSGKSVVADVFHVLGIPVFVADTEAKKCYREPQVIDKVKKEFGSSVVTGGDIDAKALAKIVFSDKASLARLNAIIHPQVLRIYDDWCFLHAQLPYTLIESAIIFESGLENMFDRIITVYAPDTLCRERIMQRDGTSAEQVDNRLHAQADPLDKVKRSDFVIYNDEKQLLIPQVLAIHQTLISIA